MQRQEPAAFHLWPSGASGALEGSDGIAANAREELRMKHGSCLGPKGERGPRPESSKMQPTAGSFRRSSLRSNACSSVSAVGPGPESFLLPLSSRHRGGASQSIPPKRSGASAVVTAFAKALAQQGCRRTDWPIDQLSRRSSARSAKSWSHVCSNYLCMWPVA